MISCSHAVGVGLLTDLAEHGLPNLLSFSRVHSPKIVFRKCAGAAAEGRIESRLSQVQEWQPSVSLVSTGYHYSLQSMGESVCASQSCADLNSVLS